MSISAGASTTPPFPLIFIIMPNERRSNGNVKHFLEVVLSQCGAFNVGLCANTPGCCFALGFRYWSLTILRQLNQHLRQMYSYKLWLIY